MTSVAQMRPRHGTSSRTNLDEADLDEAEELITKGELRKPEPTTADAHTRPLVPWVPNGSSESSDMVLRHSRPATVETQGANDTAHPVRSPPILPLSIHFCRASHPLRLGGGACSIRCAHRSWRPRWQNWR
jgi:hypothetical protein